MLSRLVKASLIWILLLSLVACQGGGKMPPQAIVEVAIATQLAKTQQALIIHLSPQIPQTPNFTLRQVNITDRETLPPDEASEVPGISHNRSPIYHVQGTYQAIIQLIDREVKDDSIFNLYLQSETELSTEEIHWSLVKPTAQGWDRIPLAN